MRFSTPLRAFFPVLLLSLACVAPTSPPAVVLNDVCPRSGKPVAADSLTSYRDQTVGFCNTHCRDDFAAHPETCAEDRAFFDRLIEGAAQERR